LHKLLQFDPDDRTPVRIATPPAFLSPRARPPWGRICSAGTLGAGIDITVPLPGGIELLVLDGSFIEGGEEFTRLSWLRLPADAMLQVTAGRGGCKVWVKSGRLAPEPRLPTAD